MLSIRISVSLPPPLPSGTGTKKPQALAVSAARPVGSGPLCEGRSDHLQDRRLCRVALAHTFRYSEGDRAECDRQRFSQLVPSVVDSWAMLSSSVCMVDSCARQHARYVPGAGAGCNSLWIKQMGCSGFQGAGAGGQFLQQLHGIGCNNCLAESGSRDPDRDSGSSGPGSAPAAADGNAGWASKKGFAADEARLRTHAGEEAG